MALHDIVQPHIADFDHDGKQLAVTCRVAFDGIEYVGRLWFAEKRDPEDAIPDRGAIPGRSRDEVLAWASRLTPPELALRYRRALSEKRRYFELRKVTEEILSKIRYINQVSISIRSGLLDKDAAAQELDVTEKQLHDLVDKLHIAAGVEAAR